jgi:glycosyltransferase involved in cell wall biosynthesis
MRVGTRLRSARAMRTSGARPEAAAADFDDEKLRVLYVHTATLPPLGADTQVHGQILRGLDRSQHELHVACVPGSTERPTPTFQLVSAIPALHLVRANLGPEFSHRSTVGRVLALFRTVPAVVTLARLVIYVRRRRIDIIHTSDRPRDALASVIIGRLTGVPSIVHAHVGFDEQWMGSTLRWALNRADALIAISDFVATSLISGGHEAARTHVARNAVELDRWRPGVGRNERRQEFGIEPAAPVVVCICRLFPAKGPAELIRSVAIVRDEFPDVRVLLVGQEMAAGYGAELVALARQLGVEQNIIFTGWRNDVPSLMAAADIYAMPSFMEPFGLVYLEAMAMELPVVALDNGGTPEVVEHKVTGLLSSPGDVEGFAANVSLLLRSPGLRAEMGRRGRRRVESDFTIARLADDIASIYRLILSERHGTEANEGRTRNGASTQ